MVLPCGNLLVAHSYDRVVKIMETSKSFQKLTSGTLADSTADKTVGWRLFATMRSISRVCVDIPGKRSTANSIFRFHDIGGGMAMDARAF